MIIEKQGDLLKEKDCIIAHQTNCKGVMGAGVALQIRKQLFSEENYNDYKEMCRTYGSSLLGHCSFTNTKKGILVANVFGEDQPTGKGLDTDYKALLKAMRSLRDYAVAMNCPDCISKSDFRALLNVKAGITNAEIKNQQTNDPEINKLFESLLKTEDLLDQLTEKYPPMDIAIPKYMGCGLAGGDWDIVYNKILVPLFKNNIVNLRIVEYKR